MKKLFAILLSVVLVASLCTVFTFAEDVKYDETQTIDPVTGDASYEVAYGFTFPINYVNGTIVGEDVTLVDNADSYATANPNWAISVQLTPVGDLYKVVKVVPTPGSAAAAGIEWGEGDKVLVVHSASSNPNEGYANWESKVVALALKAGDVLRVTDTEAYVLMPSEYPYYVTQSINTETGDASYEVAYGFNFSINYVNGSIVGEDVTLVDNADSYATANPNWAISIQLTPAGDLYKVVKVVPTPGSAAAAGIEWGEGDKVLVVHSASSNPNGGYANWESKVVSLALKAGDVLRVTDTEAYVLMPNEYPYYVTQSINPENGDASYAVAYGFTFPINYVNGTIVGEDVTLVDNADSYATANPNWAISVQLRPTEDGLYEVVKVVPTPGSAAAAGIEWGEGDKVLVVHSASSNPNEGYANWESKVVALALKTGDKLYVTDTEAYVLMPGEVINPDDDNDDDNQPTGTLITSVEFTTTVELVAGNTVFTPVLTKVNGDADLALEAIRESVAIWYNTTDWSEYPANTVLEAGTEYDLYLRFNAEDGYYFGDECTVTLVYPSGEIIGVEYSNNCSESQYASEIFFTPVEADDEGDESNDVSDEESENEPVVPGDASNMIVFAILALVAVAGAAVIVKNRK